MGRGPDIEVRRIYDAGRRAGDYRVLVDRLWPRGVSKEVADLDEWAKDAAPSPELRKWFGHEVPRFEAFRDRYCEELAGKTDLLRALVQRSGGGRLVLLYAARDPECNHARVLAEVLEEL